jgi:hypothetical protein
MGTFYTSEYGYEVVQISLDGVTFEVARATPDTQSNWVARTATATVTAGSGSGTTAWEYEAGWLLYHPEINRVMAQHFAHRSPVEQYKSKEERTCCVDVTVNLAANRGFRTNGYCLMSESFTLSYSFSSSSAYSRHRRVSPFFKTRQEAERVLALVEEQEHFGVATAVVPTRPYCLLLSTRTSSRTRTGGVAGSEFNKNLSYYITVGDANSCLYDTDMGGIGSSSRNEYNPWDVR